MIRFLLVLALLTLSAAAARAQNPALAPLRVPVPPAFERAVGNGTRTMTGEPGPRYWQNHVEYDIQATVAPRDALLTGVETVVYHNESPDTLNTVVFHLYQNLMGPYGAREQPAPATTDGMIIDSLAVGGVAVRVPVRQAGQRPDTPGAQVYGTLMRVPVTPAIPPGGTATFHVRWHFTIPGDWAPRMGMVDSTTAQIAQWYPQIAVYDDLHGWDLEQYSGTGEFYVDYGSYRYSVTAPAGTIVGGSGVLENPEDVLTDATRTALERAAGTDEIVHVLTAADFGPGTATRGAPGESLTWRFRADSVRDVAFSFSDHYLWDATRAVVDPASGRTAMVHVLYRPGAPLFDQVAAMARSALETFSSNLAPYPWPQLTQTEGGSGGMEYPMTVFVQAYQDLFRMDGVTAHEIGHEWFPMLVGSNETRYGWQDEGLNSYATFFATDAFLPDSFRGRGLRQSQEGYLRFAAAADEDLSMMSPANSFGVWNSGYGIEAYAKPSAVLWTLRATLGPETFDPAFREYVRRWSYLHPSPWDFFHAIEDATGKELDPFWYQWFFTRQRLDQAIVHVESDGGRLAVTVHNDGQVYAPVAVTATTADGQSVEWTEPVDVWYDGQETVTTTHPVAGRVVRVELDAARNFLDVDRADNVWTVQELSR